MATADLEVTESIFLCPELAGVAMAPDGFGNADFERSFRYLLV